MDVIRISNVSKTYNKTKLAVDDVSLDIESGSILGFIGPNGAGKTTTLKMMSGILKPDSGSITYGDLNIETNPIEAKKKFGFVSDDPNFFLKLKGIEYISFIGNIYGISSDLIKERTEYYSERLSMQTALNDRIDSYSHGMRQKIMIIAELIHDPEVLILDEPLTGLDPQSAYILKEMMKERAQEGKIVFFSTHVLEVAEKLCHQIAIINHGKIIYSGTLDHLRSQYNDLSLEEIFLEVTK